MAVDGHTSRNDVQLHYIDHAGDDPPLIFLHGLTANAHCFDGLVEAGRPAGRRMICLDLRGRGLSSKPPRGYSMADHAADVLAVMDHLEIEKAVVCGHSYGGLLTLYLAAHHPERVEKQVVLDVAGPTVGNPATFELIKPSLDRLGKEMPSLDLFLKSMKRLPFLDGVWSTAIEAYFRADVVELGGGRVRVRTPRDVIDEVISQMRTEDWNAHIAKAARPALLLHSVGGFGKNGTPPVVLQEQADATVRDLPDCRYAKVPGNHMTMLFGEGARAVVDNIAEFVEAT